MDNKHGYQYRGMESILRHMARRDQSYLSLWLQWTLARPNSAFRDEVVAANHASVPFKVLEALAREMLENAATEDTLENQIARTLLEAARLAQSAAARRGIRRLKPDIGESPNSIPNRRSSFQYSHLVG